jgi:hypothetical protein
MTTNIPARGATELRTLHFILPQPPAGVVPELLAGGRRHPLRPHDKTTRAGIQAQHKLGDEAGLESLTHYGADLPFAAERLQLFSVVAGRSLLLAGLHIPRICRARCRPAASKATAIGIAAKSDGNDDFLHDLFTTDDTAAVIIFLHPEVMNFDTGSFPVVYNSITGSWTLDDLSESIRSQGTAWSTRVPVTDTDGHQIYDANGNPYFFTEFSQQTRGDALQPVQAILQGIKDQPELAGHNWPAIAGQSFIASFPADSKRPESPQPKASRAGAADRRQVDGGVSTIWSVYNRSTADGLAVQSIATAEQGDGIDVEVTFQNYYARHLSVFAQYRDAHGIVIPLAELTFPPDDEDRAKFRKFDTDLARAIDVLPPQATFAGLPITEPASGQVSLPVPASPRGIANIDILCGGIGMGQNAYGDVPKIGIVLTVIFEYIFPILLAALDIAIDKTMLGDLVSSTSAELLVDNSLRALLDQVLITDMNPNELEALAKTVGQYVITTVITQYGAQLFADETVAVTAEASDPLGWAITAASLTATLADLINTTADVLQSPVVYVNTCGYTMEIEVTMHPDPNDPVFPQVATSYDVIARFSNAITDRKFTSNTVPPNAASLPAVIFDEIPAGGTVTIHVIFYSDTGWIAGQGLWQGSNALQTGEDFLDVQLTITENKVPLTAKTSYTHNSWLAYANDGSHTWAPRSKPPTDTMSNLSINDTPQYITALQSLTYNVLQSGGGATGLLGYSWQATSPSISECGSGAAGASVYLAQVLSSANPPDASLSFSGCGLAGPVNLLFDFTDPSQSGFYYIDPRNQDGGSQYQVRRFDPSSPPFQQAENICGRMLDLMSLDAVAIHQSKFMVAINTDTSKMEVVHLSDPDRPTEQAPVARLLCGLGTRAGLLSAPVAVAVAKDGTILVLENGNQRIQALDAYGHPVSRFRVLDPKGLVEWSPFLPLQPADGQTYLDMCVESTGYVYVLSHLQAEPGNDLNTNYLLDIYQPDGRHLCQTAGVAAAKIDVDYWRNVFALNYHLLISNAGLAEPSISLWIPSTPS